MPEAERIPPEILRKVRRIELSTRHLVDDLFGGEYHSVFKGMGMEFDEVREYSPGDEVRSIDWNVTARMGRPYVKRYREERELTVVLAVDASASGLFGSQDRLKSEAIAEVASVLAFSAIRNQDKVGCLIFTDRVEKFIPPEKGHRHVLRIIRELLYFKPQGSGTDLGKALEMLSHLLKRKAVVFLLSDFFDEGYETALRLAARRHDLIALSIVDPLESRIPDVGLLHVRDAETGEQLWLDTHNRWVRQHFAQEASERRRRLGQLFGRYGVDEIPLDVTQDTVAPLVRFFRQRMKRISKGIGRRSRSAAPLLLAAALGLTAALPFGLARAQQPSPPSAVPTPGLPGQAPPHGQPGAPGQAPGQVPPGLPGQSPQPQGMPIVPRQQLEAMDMPTLQDLTAASRPRWETSEAPGISVESVLARDLQTIGERNEISWRIVLPEGGELVGAEWNLGDEGRIQPLPTAQAVPDTSGLGLETETQETRGLHPVFMIADTLRGEGPDTLRYRLPFTTFLPDTFAIPAQVFHYRPRPGAEMTSLETPPLELACMSVLKALPDSAALRDWKSPGDLRVDWLPVLLKAGLPALALLILASALLYYLWRRRRSREEPLAPAIPPDEEAMAALDELALADLPARGAWHEYYLRLSQILRRYLSRRYHLPFIDWTTEEIELALTGPRPRLEISGELRDTLLENLSRADLVKFAHRTPSRAECLDSMQAGRRLVRSTRRVAQLDASARAAPLPAEGVAS